MRKRDVVEEVKPRKKNKNVVVGSKVFGKIIGDDFDLVTKHDDK